MSTQRRSLSAISVAGVRLSNRGWAFLVASVVLFVAAYTSGRFELLSVATLAGALPVFAIVFVGVRRPRLSVTRSFSPHVVAAGTAASVTLMVRNVAPSSSVGARWWDAMPWRPFQTAESVLPALQGRGARFVRGNAIALGYQLLPPRRGIYPVGPLTVELGDAFGLASSTVVLGEAESIVVTPEVVPLADSGLTMPAGDGEARLVQRRATGDEDDTMTREYRDGDAMRRVHWRATARKGELMVRQEEQRSFPEARILVDTRRGGYRDAGDGDPDESESAAFEWVVRMVASVAVHLRRAGFLVTVTESGLRQLDADGHRRTWHDEEFLVSLASLALTDPAALPLGTRAGLGPIVAILSGPEPETVDWMLQQRHPGELAVAFMVHGSSALDSISRQFGVPTSAPAVAARLTEAGWLVVPVRAEDDHAAAWEAVVVETGRFRGTA